MQTLYQVQIELPIVGNKKPKLLGNIGGLRLGSFRRKGDMRTRHSKTCNRAIHPHSPAIHAVEVNTFF